MGAIATQTVDTTERLAALRKLMEENNVDAYIVPSEDQRMGFSLIRFQITADAFLLQILVSTLPSAINVGHSYLDSTALLVRLSLGLKILSF